MHKISAIRLGLLAALVTLPASATEPGTPMDCTDFLLPPGIVCSQFSDPGQGGGVGGTTRIIDNDGQAIGTSTGSVGDIVEVLGPCGAFSFVELGLLFHYGEGGVRTTIGSARGRCLDAATSTIEHLRSGNVTFDPVRGTLFVNMTSSCLSRGDLCDDYGGGGWAAQLDGFTPLAAVLPEPPTAAPLCDNGLDDDGDGAIDLDDKQCKSAADNDESRP